MQNLDLAVEQRDPKTLRASPRNARTHSAAQIRQIAKSIERFGFTNPVLLSDDDEIIAGHGRVEAARILGMARVPVVRLSHLNGAERRAYMLADNQLALKAGWNPEILGAELEALIDLKFDLDMIGFSTAEIDLAIGAASKAAAKVGNDDIVPVAALDVITRPGDIWLLGRHRLICGDARDSSVMTSLLGDERADLMFTDPPYNVVIDRNVCGSGKIRHREFACASGEMDRTDFTAFLATTLCIAACHMRNGAIAYVCMDWRHVGEMHQAGSLAFDEYKQLCVWNKTNAGMGTFYRSKHELIFVFKIGDAAHVNNFELGANGRYRTNVWDYPGISSATATRGEELAMHPTVKPVALVKDAIEDCSNRGDIVLDCFGGSGTTLIAAERCGREARLIEIDPIYCDTIIKRFQKATGQTAILASSGEVFDQVSEARHLHGKGA